MFNNKFALYIILLFVIFKCDAQDCNLTIKGFVFDEATKSPLSVVNVIIQETANGVITNDKGDFLLDSICKGEYHLIISHIGCETKKMLIELSKDTVLHIALPHTTTSLGTIVIAGKKGNYGNHPNLSISRQAIDDNTNQNLSGLLENEAGIYLIKNGSGISKPVVHGLYGNRLTILNNGIIQSGQQWGNDHSPEIDPYAVDKISVLKGANAIEYGGGNLGSVILVEPKRIEKEPHLHGQFNYAFETNGRGNSLNTRLEKYTHLVAWRINGSLKKSGDRKTSDYFLNNTGIEELNFSIQLEKSLKEKLFLEFYASTFNTRLGILRGSHIGNLTDLEQALTREIPFFTEPDFSYALEAPRQTVSHHLIKAKAKYFLKENQILEFTIASQLNNRKEFDIRRSERADIPALNLDQYTYNSELKYTKDLKADWRLKIGLQNIFTDNTNNPETGILPLIPDYLSWKSGLFSTLSKSKEKTRFNIGVRYDYEYQSVATISKTVPREIIRFENQFHNISGLLSIQHGLTKSQSLSLNLGFAMRNPGINELYSNGLHQGVSGIEEGDVNLKAENALKNVLEYKWFPNPNFSFNALAYYQYFKDYVFLNPQDEIRLTIRGAFPVFKYEQTDANIYGLDIYTQFTISNSFVGLLKYSYIRGDDTKNNVPLIFIPPNKLFGSLVYRAKKKIKLSKNIIMEESEIEVNNRFVLEQKNILPEQDFVQPPPGYNLFGLKVSTNIVFPNYRFRCFVKADNLFNAQYRDYLNRQRYFADDLGISIILGISFKF